MASTQIQKLASDAKIWIASPEGQAAIKEHVESSTRICEQLRESMRVPPELLHRPFDV